MKYNGVDISKLTDEQLLQADTSASRQLAIYNTKINSDKFKEKMKNQPPPAINPAFGQLQIEIASEIEKRKLSHG